MKFDGKSWRLLGLAVGLAGAWWLLTDPPRRLQNAQGNDMPALIDALWSADSRAVSGWLTGGGSPNAILDERQTRPLQVLLYGPTCGQPEAALRVLSVTTQLLDAGADVNAADTRGTTPLMLAAARCGADVVKRLLAAGADPNRRNLLGITAFEMTLAQRTEGGRELARSGFRLSAQRYAHYQHIYHDEASILAHLALAAPDGN